MATGVTVADVNGVFKQIYPDGVPDLVPETSIIQKTIPLQGGIEQLGSKFMQPVIMSLENGITFGGTAGDLFTLNPAVPMNIIFAEVNGCDHVMRSAIAYGAASRAVQKGPAAFGNLTSMVMKSAMESISRVVEIQLLYGQASTGLGQVDSIDSVNATTLVLTFTSTEWAPGIWSGAKNLKLDMFQEGASVSDSPLNTNAALVVKTANFVNKTITVTGNSADISAIVTYYGTPGNDGFVTWYNSYSDQFVGMNKIFSNTSGSLFNISAADYELWGSNTFNVGGNFSLDVLGEGIATAQARGLDGDIDLLVNPITWRYLNDTVTARRRFIGTQGNETAEFGTRGVEYYTQSGVVRVWSHIYVKTGEAYAYPREELTRVGSSKLSFQNPGGQFEGDIFTQLQDQAGFEFRIFGNEALLGLKPATFTLFTGITNS